MYALFGSAELNGLDPEDYLRRVLAHIAQRSDDNNALLPGNIKLDRDNDVRLAT